MKSRVYMFGKKEYSYSGYSYFLTEHRDSTIADVSTGRSEGSACIVQFNIKILSISVHIVVTPGISVFI